MCGGGGGGGMARGEPAMATTPSFQTINFGVRFWPHVRVFCLPCVGPGVGVGGGGADTSGARSKISEDGVQSLFVSSRSTPLLQVHSESADRRLPPTWVEP